MRSAWNGPCSDLPGGRPPSSAPWKRARWTPPPTSGPSSGSPLQAGSRWASPQRLRPPARGASPEAAHAGEGAVQMEVGDVEQTEGHGASVTSATGKGPPRTKVRGAGYHATPGQRYGWRRHLGVGGRVSEHASLLPAFR